MTWLIIGLLALAGGLAVFTRWNRRHPAGDDTLVADLLGPPPGRVLSAGQVPPAQAGQVPLVPRAREQARPAPAAPHVRLIPRAREHAGPMPGPGRQPPGKRVPQPSGYSGPPPAGQSTAQPAADSDWLGTQLAWITSWSAKMHQQIASPGAGPAVPPQAGPEPAAAPQQATAGGPAAHEPAAPQPSPPPAPQRCTATTAKGSQCRLRARPGESTCAVHGRRPARS